MRISEPVARGALKSVHEGCTMCQARPLGTESCAAGGTGKSQQAGTQDVCSDASGDRSVGLLQESTAVFSSVVVALGPEMLHPEFQ